ncbi:MAG: tRNA lysidine(34) synthetase TilS [Burkholderiales bacterium]
MKTVPTFLDATEEQLRLHGVQDCTVCVGLSGGIDSIVLLDVLGSHAAAHGLGLSAVHVNHGLSPHAGDWETFCRGICAAEGVPLTVKRVSVARRGEGLEAAAREARFAAFSSVRCDYLALAHNQDDQAETLLLQLLRGAGAKGLSAMPVVRDWFAPAGATAAKGPAKLLRPLLDVLRSEILDYARARQLAWMEDESNTDVSLDRNFLRHEVFPLIVRRYPAVNRTLARAARNLADAALLADAIGEIDWQTAATAEGLHADVLRDVGVARALNLLRGLFALKGQAAPHRSALEEGLRQCLHARSDAQVRVAFGKYSLRRYRGIVQLVDDGQPPPGWTVPWQGENELPLPAPLGRLRFRSDANAGISRARLERTAVSVRGRRGGERIAPGPGRPRRELKHLLQEMGTPPWERSHIPLLFCGETLAWVPGVGIAPEFRARPGEDAMEVSWDRQ